MEVEGVNVVAVLATLDTKRLDQGGQVVGDDFRQ